MLSAIANQISGAIKLIQSNEAEKKDAERLNVLRRAMTEMLRIAQKNESDLWLTVLTIATANFGTGFNRALLFLENEERTSLVCRAGIGTNDPKTARRGWEEIVKKEYRFDDFLKELRKSKIHFTHFHKLVGKIVLPLDNGKNDDFMEVLRDGHPLLVKENQFEREIPVEIKKVITPSNCAFLPILTGRRAIGLVLVDNKHNGKPLDSNMLNRLQTVLSHAGLVWEMLREQKKSESLLDANYQIMGEARLQSLQETLQNICETARTLSEADWALVYPLKEGEEYIFDRENAAYAGQLTHDVSIKERPNPNGVSVYILRTGKLAVNDIKDKDAKIGRKRIENHDFIKKEGVKAVLGIAIRDIQRDEPLGILYLNYRSSQKFSPSDEHRAMALASLAAIAISNARRFDEQRQRKRLEAAQTTAEAIGTELDLPKMFSKVLHRLHKYFKKTTLCIMTYEEDEYALKFAPSTLEFYKIQNPDYQGQHIYPLNGKSLACRAARNALQSKTAEPLNVPDVREVKDYLPLNPQTRSEICFPLLSSEQKLLGMLVLERPKLHGFDDDDVALVQTVARQLSMAMERAQNSEQLAFKSAVAANNVLAAEIAHDVNQEVGHIRIWASIIKDIVEEESELANYTDKIEESASILAELGPWTYQRKETLPLDDALSNNIEKIRRKDVLIELQLNCQGVYVRVNLFTFLRALKHLIQNASHEMRNMSNKKIIIRSDILSNDSVEIQIQDFGPGIDEKIRPYIFQRQYTSKGGGGVGLLLTRQMVEDMGGKIMLLPSKPDQGATFSIRLPIEKIPSFGAPYEESK